MPWTAADSTPPNLRRGGAADQGPNEAPESGFHHTAAKRLPFSVVECPPNTICEDTTWTASGGPILLSSDTTVAAGVVLTIEPGVQVRLAPGVSLRAGAGAGLDVRGSSEAPVVFANQGGGEVWGELAADGPDSHLSLRHADVSAGSVKFRNGATGLIEDSHIHHYISGSTPIAGCSSAKRVVVRRSHFDEYYETLWQHTPILIEDSLFENANSVNGDALDFDGAPPGSAIRRCTFRHGPQSNTDAIDLGSGTMGTVVEDCLIYGFPNDKGISIGEDSLDIVIRNCLIFACDSGVAVKDGSTVSIAGCTIVANAHGIRAYNKLDPSAPSGGGRVLEFHDNILWDNPTNIELLNGATFRADHSLIGGNGWEGESIVNSDPQFINAQQRDHRLQPSSPGLRAGRLGGALGARFPVGAAMASSHPVILLAEPRADSIALGFWLDSVGSHYLASSGSPAENTWIPQANFPRAVGPRWVEMVVPIANDQRYFALVRQP